MKYVIFFCDDCELLNNTIMLFQRIHPTIAVITFSDAGELISHMNTGTPELILVYLTGQSSNYISFVKDIRESRNSALIPILVYHVLPTEQEISKLLQGGINN